MIIWRNGKGGFVGGLKRLIKGVFDPSHSITSATVVVPETSISGQFDIRMPPEDRGIRMAFEDRRIMMPPDSRNTKL